MSLPISANSAFHPGYNTGQRFNGTAWPKMGIDSKQPIRKWNT